MNDFNWDLDSIYHTGIPGMKWYRRRYQNEDGSLTEAGRLRYGKNKKGYEEYRKAALNSGDYKKIREVAKDSSVAELSNAINKANLINQLNGKIAESHPKKTIDDYIDTVLSPVKRFNDIINTGFTTYNNIAKLYNLGNGDLGDMKLIGYDNSKMKTSGEKLYDKKRKEIVNKAMESGDNTKISEALRYMNKDELTKLQMQLNLKEKVK